MTEPGKVEGSCLCGSIRFSLALPSLWCAHCHCLMCRKAHGSGFVTWVGFPEQAMSIESGSEILHWYQSSQPAKRGFCKQCGSTLFFASERWPGEIHVAMGCLDDPIDRKPQAHVYHDNRVDWVQVDDALAIHRTEGN